MEYQDFALRFESGPEGGFRARVTSSPAGQARSPFSPPDWAPGTLDRLEAWNGFGRELVRAVRHDQEAARADRLGQDLFRSLFPDRVGRCYAESRAKVEAARETGLRLRLCFDPEDEATFRFAGLPWELLYDPETQEPLGHRKSLSVCRYLEVPRPESPLHFEPPLRIALLASSPQDLPPLAVEREAREIQSVCQKEGNTEVVLLPGATLKGLREELLRDGRFHVLHFMGHGGFDARTGRGCLVLEDENRRSALLDGKELAYLLDGLDSLRLVVLNACRTAQTTFEHDFDPFGGVAAALVRAGLPAVVAMQLSISDDAALAFSEAFYRLVARGTPLDVATAEGRLAIRLQDRGSLEWAIPALFLRSADGRILVPTGRTDKAEDLDAAHLERAFQSLEADDYLGSFQHLRQVSAAGRESARYHFLCVLTILAGRSCNAIHPAERTRVNGHLTRARRLAPEWRPVLMLMLIMDLDYYELHGMANDFKLSTGSLREAVGKALPAPLDETLIARLELGSGSRKALGFLLESRP